MNLEKEMRKMCNIDDTEGLNKDTEDIFIPNAISIAKAYAEEMCKKQKRADHAFGNDQLSGTEMSIDLRKAPLEPDYE